VAAQRDGQFVVKGEPFESLDELPIRGTDVRAELQVRRQRLELLREGLPPLRSETLRGLPYKQPGLLGSRPLGRPRTSRSIASCTTLAAMVRQSRPRASARSRYTALALRGLSRPKKRTKV